MSQPALSKQMLKLERSIGFQVFKHNHQAAELTDAGQVFIAEAHEVVAHAERAILSARAVLNGSVDILNIGKSSYTDPFLVSTLLSIHLPLFPDMKIKLWSNFSNELARQVIAGTLDLAVITGVPDKAQLSVMNIVDNPFHIVMSMDVNWPHIERFAYRKWTAGIGYFSASTPMRICTTQFKRLPQVEARAPQTSTISQALKRLRSWSESITDWHFSRDMQGGGLPATA